MAHGIVGVEGLPEGLDNLQKSLDRYPLPHRPLRVREFKLFDFQYDERDELVFYTLINKNISPTEDLTHDNTMQKFDGKNYPIKHGRIRLFIGMIGNLLRPLGFKPFPKTCDYELARKLELPRLPLVRFYPIVVGKDIKFNNIPENKKEEFL